MKRNEAYNVLGLTESASDDDIRKAFRKLAAENHPDKNSGSKDVNIDKAVFVGSTAELMKLIKKES